MVQYLIMPKKYFIVESAEKEIPKIKKSLAMLQSIKKAIDAISSVRIDIEEFGFDEVRETGTKLQKEYYKLNYEFYKELEKLESIGCILKDLELGLVDFYCKFEGRDIFLCWKLGEKRIEAWHEADSGFAGRKPIANINQYQQ